MMIAALLLAVQVVSMRPTAPVILRMGVGVESRVALPVDFEGIVGTRADREALGTRLTRTAEGELVFVLRPAAAANRTLRLRSGGVERDLIVQVSQGLPALDARLRAPGASPAPAPSAVMVATPVPTPVPSLLPTPKPTPVPTVAPITVRPSPSPRAQLQPVVAKATPLPTPRPTPSATGKPVAHASVGAEGRKPVTQVDAPPSSSPAAGSKPEIVSAVPRAASSPVIVASSPPKAEVLVPARPVVAELKPSPSPSPSIKAVEVAFNAPAPPKPPVVTLPTSKPPTPSPVTPRRQEWHPRRRVGLPGQRGVVLELVAVDGNRVELGFTIERGASDNVEIGAVRLGGVGCDVKSGAMGRNLSVSATVAKAKMQPKDVEISLRERGQTRWRVERMPLTGPAMVDRVFGGVSWE